MEEELQNEMDFNYSGSKKININTPRCNFCSNLALLILHMQTKEDKDTDCSQERLVCINCAEKYKAHSKREALIRNIKSQKKVKRNIGADELY